MLFYCLWRNVEISCHKNFVIVSCHEQTPPITTSYKCHSPTVRRRRGDNTCRSQRWQHAMKPDIGSDSRFMPTPAFDAPVRRSSSEYRNDVLYGKTRMWLLDGENFLRICLFVLTECTNVTERQTDRRTDKQTPHDGNGHACIASRGKNSFTTGRNKKMLFSTNRYISQTTED